MATNQALSKLLKGRVVDSVRQRDKELDIDFEDGSTMTIVLAAPTQSIKLVSDADKVEYSE